MPIINVSRTTHCERWLELCRKMEMSYYLRELMYNKIITPTTIEHVFCVLLVYSLELFGLLRIIITLFYEDYNDDSSSQ